MPRKRKPSGRLPTGPWTFADLERAIKLDGWVETKHGSHLNYTHPTKPGKVQLSDKWDGVKKGGFVFQSVARQAGLSAKQLQRLLAQ